MHLIGQIDIGRGGCELLLKHLNFGNKFVYWELSRGVSAIESQLGKVRQLPQVQIQGKPDRSLILHKLASGEAAHAGKFGWRSLARLSTAAPQIFPSAVY
jgi:hypothetical protein